MKKTKVEIIKSDFNEKAILDHIESSQHFNQSFPMVYILHGEKHRNKAYVGETTHIKMRMKQHLKTEDKRKLEDVYIMFHPHFNQSATYNIETNLIQYMLADDAGFEMLNKSQKAQKNVHQYYHKDEYHVSIFGEIWDILLDKGMVENTLDEIRNKDIYKLSPFTSLNEEQLGLREQIIDYCLENIDKDTDERFVFVVKGDAGTGKSVLLSSTFKYLQDALEEHDRIHNGFEKIQRHNYLLVNHSEMLKTYVSIGRRVSNLRVKNFMKPTTFVNNIAGNKKNWPKCADVVFVDEAHLTLTKQDSYYSFRFDNHLHEIIKRSKITIVIFDDKQVLKAKSYWNKQRLKDLENKYKVTYENLTSQMRMMASQQSLAWINALVNKEILPLPVDDGYEIRIFDSAQVMYEAIKARNDKHGLSRVVSTFDFVHKKDKLDYFVKTEDFNLPWNREYNETWAECKESINEVGSIYTIQGFDLNYVGVIIGPSIKYDAKKDRIVVDTDAYCDSGAYRDIEKVAMDCNTPSEKIKEEIVLNSLNVLLKRGVQGLFIYAYDPELRARLLRASKND